MRWSSPAASTPFARRRRMEGTVIVRFTIGRDGKLLSATVGRSANIAVLDDAALATLTAIGTFAPAPIDVEGASFSFEVPLVFRLTANGS